MGSETMVWWGNQENTKNGTMRKTTKLIGLFVLQLFLTVEKISSEDRNCSPNVCVCRKGNSCSLEEKDCKCKRENALSLMCLQQRNVFVQFHGWKDQDKTWTKPTVDIDKSCLTRSFKTIIPILGLDNENDKIYKHFPFRKFLYVDFSV